MNVCHHGNGGVCTGDVGAVDVEAFVVFITEAEAHIS